MTSSTTPKPKPKQRQNGGRPCSFTPQLGQEICARIASGQHLKQICKDPHMPHPATILSWISKMDPDEQISRFHESYARARVAAAEVYLGEIRELTLSTHEGNAKAAQVKISALQWLCGKMNPRYAEHWRITHDGVVKHEHSVDMVPDWLKERLEGPGQKALEQIRPTIDVTPTPTIEEEQSRERAKRVDRGGRD